jgi:hypothetical protein
MKIQKFHLNNKIKYNKIKTYLISKKSFKFTVFSMNSCHLHVSLFDGLLELVLLHLLLLVALLRVALQLFGRELQVEQVLLHRHLESIPGKIDFKDFAFPKD